MRRIAKCENSTGLSSKDSFGDHSMLMVMQSGGGGRRRDLGFPTARRPERSARLHRRSSISGSFCRNDAAGSRCNCCSNRTWFRCCYIADMEVSCQLL
ncbi:hypothetical protein V6N12_043619 [Hibiscus sabdariffa]|uniref:Uncharacterized protein n=1 Tax=Hibiscus sabdariffa TaxID=183260 RepID=A0ABR2DFX4_9ROSI